MKGDDVRHWAHRAWLLASVAAGMLTGVMPVLPRASAQQTGAPSLLAWPTTTTPAASGRTAFVTPPISAGDRPAPRQGRPSEGDPLDPDAEPPPERGDADGPREPAMPQDGVLDEREAQAAVDGRAGDSEDGRSEEDIRAFSPLEPAAGYDPTVFSIEPEPQADRRPARFARKEPYEAVGVRIGSFILFPEVELGAAAFSNVFRSSGNIRGDAALEARPAARLVSNWGTHALELNARGLASFHDAYPSEDDRDYAIEARGRLDVTRGTNVETTIGRELTQETRGSVNARFVGSDRTDIVTERVAVALNHRFNRLAVQLRGSIIDRDYAPGTDDAGAFIANDDRDVTQRTGALRAAWSFKPELAVFGEVAGDDRSFRAPSRSDGILRDSSGERVRLGVAFGSTSRTVRGEASIGTARQRFEDGRLPEVRGVIVDANVGWRLSGLTSLLFSASSDVGESTVAGSGGALVRTAGVEVRHAFRRHLIGTAGIKVTRADYEGTSLVERDVTASAALEYHLNREVMLFGRYEHIDFESTSPADNYNADEVRLGVRVRR